ncbi:MAG: Unknown protein [uncultured Sulfurovum sp.]|uniref:Ricin B lectin domain-containing protein n=1 Tax=uncultured Sulfurovum sp. TaxID=269237 RepID=A0A6S6T037_9BACT|nr:MAG: Unknown protein [uncultured Sulfurovum sp.]
MIEVYIQQVSSGRYLDAYEHRNDNDVVTQDKQDNDSQKWILTSVKYDEDIGYIVRIQQKNTQHYLDAYTHVLRNYKVVTRDKQNNSSQDWIVKQTGHNIYTIQQFDNNRYMDAYETSGRDFTVVTRDAQDNTTQEWQLSRTQPLFLDSLYTIKHSYDNDRIKAYKNSQYDYQAVMEQDRRNFDADSEWIIYTVGDGEVRIQQNSTERFLDAHESDALDATYNVVTRPEQDNDSQIWIVDEKDILRNLSYEGPGVYCAFKQKSSGYTLDIIQLEDNSEKVVTIQPPENRGEYIDLTKRREYIKDWLVEWIG